MALPFLNGVKKKRDQILAVDLGSRTTKAVLMERRGDKLALTRYALLDAPIYDKKFSAELLSDHLRRVSENLGGGSKNTVLAIGLDDAVVRQVDLPLIPVDEMRMILKNNTRGYLQQDLPNHVFDCYIFPSRQNAKLNEASKSAGVPKAKVLVTAAKQQLIADFQMAVKNAGLLPDYIIPGLIAPVNALELAMPEAFATEVVALVDMGFKHTSVCVIDRGELALIRVMNIGGDKLTTGLTEAMSITYAEAEGIKVGMAPEVQSALEMQVIPLGRELRASLDFFEHQQDRPVSQIFVSGGSARSEMILQMLQAEVIVECKTWNPAANVEMALKPEQSAEINHVAPQLSVAIGAAIAAF
jgi:type IV pilus assembly protein PilM